MKITEYEEIPLCLLGSTAPEAISEISRVWEEYGDGTIRVNYDGEIYYAICRKRDMTDEEIKQKGRA